MTFRYLRSRPWMDVFINQEYFSRKMCEKRPYRCSQNGQPHYYRILEARDRHAGVESAIGAIQAGNGLKRCRDRGEIGFDRYLGLAILGRNIHTLGKILIAQEAANSRAAYSKR